ncbi:MAG: aldo/keto reductase [Eubacterium sp.]|nr:aldo/keto reductase [Eubacterium sp.]
MEEKLCEKRQLGSSDIYLSPLGFGCAGAWGKSLFGKPMISYDEAKALILRSLDLGITYFDTGHNYGFAEERLGQILAETGINRKDIILSTKFGERAYNSDWLKDFSVKWMRESFELSLKRLKTDYIDLFMCHGGDVSDLKPQLLEALYGLKKKGVVRAVGINTFSDDVISYVKDIKCFDFVMLDYNIMRQDREPVIKELYDSKIGVIAGAALGQALYSKSFFKVRHRKDLWYIARCYTRFKEQFKKSGDYRFINGHNDFSAAQAALSFTLQNKYVSSALFGTTSLEHLEENVKALDIEIPKEIITKIKRQGE